MVGTSLYVLIDTLFISIAAGALGLTALNLALPIFNCFNAIGLLLGVGGATIFSLNKVLHPERVESLYSSLIIVAAVTGVIVAILMDIFATPVVNFLGANDQTRELAITYVRIVAWCGPFVMCNLISLNFIRNDGNPTLTMMATVIETTSVIAIDWFFIFGLGFKMEGAAMAAIFSPAISLVVLSFHRRFKKRQLHLHWVFPSIKSVWHAARLGAAAALNELSSGVSVFFFNHVLLILVILANNYAVAAYGVISNIAIMVLAIANGVALGVQPIVSREYGERHYMNAAKALRVGVITTLTIALIEFAVLIVFKYPIINIFNTQHSWQLVHFASVGLPIYFTSAFFTALNYLFILFLTAINGARASFSLSLLRGYLILLPLIMILPTILGIDGVWAAVPITEMTVTVVGAIFIRQRIHHFNQLDS
ncbi:MATE family efflux transporter [Limosilactobacillus frumenti]|uniref:MATE family efflux transporter n=1 Tax=Limosilactobacillus frumenti TaxID=104955 RepID=UPI0015EC76EB|nr:MATE family efflux transporter [Limosilactobacillus frumenti]MBA2913330.1 MATE family efflux transporter [Limosilactobacillus frumenti]